MLDETIDTTLFWSVCLYVALLSFLDFPVLRSQAVDLP